MKIIQVAPKYFPHIGGVEKIVQEISEGMVKRGHYVEVVTTDPSGTLPKNETINGVKVVRFKSFAPNDAYYFAPGIYPYMKNIDCDLVHAHNYHAFPAFFACLANKGDRQKFVLSPYFHGKGHTSFRNFLHKIYKLWLGKCVFNKADIIIALSKFEIDLIKDKFSNIQNEFITISPGVDNELFISSRPSTKEVNKSLLYVGRVEEYKGIQYVIHALEYLSKISDDRYILNIVGSGPFENKLKKTVGKTNVEVNWHGWASGEKLWQQYRKADLLVLLSSYETFGIVVAEALASKVPALVVESSALKEFVDNKVCFSVKNPTDAKELGDKIYEICDMDIDFSGLSDDKVRSWDKVVDEYERAYLNIY